MTDHAPSVEERWRQIMRQLGELGYSREMIDAIPTEAEAWRLIRERTPPKKSNGNDAEAPASTVASVPFMITAAMKAGLRARGYTDQQIADMRPADAHQILNAAAVTERGPSPPTQPDQASPEPEQPQSDDDGIADPAARRVIAATFEKMRNAGHNELAMREELYQGAILIEPFNDPVAEDALDCGAHRLLRPFFDVHEADDPESSLSETINQIIGRGLREARERRSKRGGAEPTQGPSRTEGDRRQQQWQEPHPLPDRLLPVTSFDMKLMPKNLRPWVSDISERMQCPPDYVAVSIMTAAGSVIGLQVGIRPQVHDDWTVTPNLWAMPIGRPGMLKSPAMEAAIWPLKKLSAMSAECHKMEMAAFEVREKTAKLLCEADANQAKKILQKDRNADVSSLLGTGEKQKEPALRRYIANDSNVASLGVLLQQNPNGLLVHRDEIIPLLVNLDREDHVDERSFYLTGWNGDSTYTFDRIGRGLNQAVERVCLSVLGSTQPARISPYLARTIRGGQGGDGLLQRFGLLVWPDIPPEWKNVDRYSDKDAKKAVMEVFERLDHLDMEAIGAKRDRDPYTEQEDGLPYLRFSIDGYDLFHAWRDDLEKLLRSGDLHPALEAHLAKYRKLVPALALILDLADRVTRPADQMAGPVGAPAVQTAIAWSKYLETHARRAYGCVTAAAADTAKAILDKIRTGALQKEFGSRDVWRPAWAKLTDRETVDAGLQMLVDYDWLDIEKVATGGRPQTVYKLNPKAKL
jgi:hypothetical protein